MANPLRQRLGALLARPSTRDALMASRPTTTKRFFAASAHKHDDAEETEKWKNITIAAYIGCIAMGIYTLSGEEHHGGEQPAYSYLHIRNKQFPWGPDGLFEYKEEHKEH